MSQIVFLVSRTPDGFQGFSDEESLFIEAATMEALKSDAEVCVRRHFINRSIPSLIRLRQDETTEIHTPVSEHPWYQELYLLGKKLKTDKEIGDVIDYFTEIGYPNGYPYEIWNPFLCAERRIHPNDLDDEQDDYFDSIADQVTFDNREYRDPIDRYFDELDNPRNSHLEGEIEYSINERIEQENAVQLYLDEANKELYEKLRAFAIYPVLCEMLATTNSPLWTSVEEILHSYNQRGLVDDKTTVWPKDLDNPFDMLYPW